MKALAVIAIILALIAAIGVVCIIWVIAWLSFEETKIGHAITNKVEERLYRWKSTGRRKEKEE